MKETVPFRLLVQMWFFPLNAVITALNRADVTRANFGKQVR